MESLLLHLYSAAGRIGSFWWRNVCKLITNFRGISKCTFGDEKCDSFLKDRWGENLMAKTYDRLFSYAINTDVTVADMLQYQDEQQLLSHFACIGASI
jgi:hypothetical protein